MHSSAGPTGRDAGMVGAVFIVSQHVLSLCRTSHLGLLGSSTDKGVCHLLYSGHGWIPAGVQHHRGHDGAWRRSVAHSAMRC